MPLEPLRREITTRHPFLKLGWTPNAVHDYSQAIRIFFESANRIASAFAASSVSNQLLLQLLPHPPLRIDGASRMAAYTPYCPSTRRPLITHPVAVFTHIALSISTSVISGSRGASCFFVSISTTTAFACFVFVSTSASHALDHVIQSHVITPLSDEESVIDAVNPSEQERVRLLHAL